ncbi:MAG: energy-coupling factor transporter transmembrane protein EcfT [Oscillospiraceae bacterium]|jgi:energy-coupling factor transport system permease protein|nr:energy-coupling factor transporter transmembrane protein EcfT [Oscillospiraceae bacterium]
MLKDITLGQYFPGESFIHRLDPRTKLLCTVLYIAALFMAKFFISYALMLFLLVFSVAVTGIRPSAFLRGLKPLLLIIIFTAVLNVFYARGGTQLFSWWVFTITTEGLKTAFFMVLRIMLLICGTFLLTYTTTPMALTDGLELIMNPLKKLRVPVHEFAMMMSIALRFIPTLIEEADKITSAQKARGANFETGRLTERVKALLPLLVPLFVSAFRRADELAVAMEARCYRGGEGRTRMKKLCMGARDFLTIAGFSVLLAGIAVLSSLGL